MGFLALFVIFFLPLGMDDSTKEKLSTPYDLKIYFEKREVDDELATFEEEMNYELLEEQEILIEGLSESDDILVIEE